MRAVLSLLSVSMLFSCEAEFETPKTGSVEVGFYIGERETRTSMLSNGLSAEWLAEDKLSVWAKDAGGTDQLSNQIFELYGLENKRGFFTSTLSSAMPEGTYTYYCSYPSPLNVTGTQAIFNLPSVQDGKVTGGADIMIATPVQHGPLTAIPDLEDHSGLAMSMNRMMHQFRFYIPQNNTLMNSEKIYKMELTFPREVCGKILADLADPSKNITLSEGGRKMTLQLSEPLEISAESKAVYKFACVALAPTTFEAGEKLSIRAFTEDQIAIIDPIDLRSKTLLSGHSTPVMLIVKELVDYPYVIKFTLSSNDVGENVRSVKLVAPSGCKWPDSGNNIYVYNPGRDINVGETISMRFADYEDYAKFSGAKITVELETENTITTATTEIGTILTGVAKHTSYISASVPYLLYQDFSSIGTYSDGHDAPTVGTDSDTYKDITELSSIGLSGWYGTRFGVKSGAARICCRYENVDVYVYKGSAYYKGRLYTPPLSRIKEGKDVKVQVTYKYGSNREERKADGFMGIGGKKPDKSPILYFGINTQDVVTNPDSVEGNIIDSITGMLAGSGFSSATPSSLQPMVIKGEILDKENGSYTNLPKSKTLEISGVDKYMRLGWILTTDNTGSNTNANYWFYIDEIKVQIVK